MADVTSGASASFFMRYDNRAVFEILANMHPVSLRVYTLFLRQPAGYQGAHLSESPFQSISIKSNAMIGSQQMAAVPA